MRTFTVPYLAVFSSRYTVLGCQTQTPEFSVRFCHRLFLQSHESNVLSCSECIIAKIFRNLAPAPHWGEFPSPPDSLAAQWFYSSLHSLKSQQHLKKLLDAALVYILIVLFTNISAKLPHYSVI